MLTVRQLEAKKLNSTRKKIPSTDGKNMTYSGSYGTCHLVENWYELKNRGVFEFGAIF